MANGTPCIFDDCALPGINLSGLCGKHYGKFVKNGHPKVQEAAKEARKAASLKLLGRTPEQAAELELRNKERNRRHQRTARLARYGMTEADFARMWERQSGLCAICKRKLARTGTARCNIDHDHATGKVRGLLCSFCNTGLGLFGDTAEGVAAALAYLRPAKTTRRVVRPSAVPAWTQDSLFAA